MSVKCVSWLINVMKVQRREEPLGWSSWEGYIEDDSRFQKGEIEAA